MFYARDKGMQFLLADIGGTNARFALSDGHAIHQVKVLPTSQFEGIEQAIHYYLNSLKHPTINAASIAIAAPVDKDQFSMSNNHWVIDKTALAQALSFAITWCNDFEAQALAVTKLQSDQLVSVKPGIAKEGGNCLVIGPGTGLGVAGLVATSNGWQPIIGEGGHAGFSPANKFDQQILAVLLDRFDHVCVEKVLSGTGIIWLYKAVAEVRGEKATLLTSEEVTKAAFNKIETDQLAVITMAVFFRQLGHAVANAALTLGATGGVYLTGGLLPKFQQELIDSEFVAGFCNSLTMKEYLVDIPVYLNANEMTGLLGAAVKLQYL